MTGRKLKYKRDLHFEFGSYIEARNPYGDSSMTNCTSGMIPTKNIQGSVHYFLILIRDSATVLPMPDIVVSMLNKLADEDKLEDRVTRDPEFKVRNQVLRLHADHDEQLIPDTTEIPQFEGSETTQPTLNDERPTVDNKLSLLIPRDVWDAETRRKDLGLVLDDGVIKDADGDVINGVPTYVRITVHQHHTVSNRVKVRLQINHQTMYNRRTAPRDSGRSIISSSMFLKEKFNANCKFDKLKVRLVAGGHQRDRSVYSDLETSSPTVSTTSSLQLLQRRKTERSSR